MRRLRTCAPRTQTVDAMARIELEKHYAAPPARVWRALTDAEAVSTWLMPSDIRPIIGHEFTFQSKPYPGFDGTVRCRVLEVVPEQLLVYTWSGGSLRDTVVRFELWPSGTGTRLLFFHTGFEGLLNSLIVRRILASGWRGELLGKRLSQYLQA